MPERMVGEVVAGSDEHRAGCEAGLAQAGFKFASARVVNPVGLVVHPVVAKGDQRVDVLVGLCTTVGGARPAATRTASYLVRIEAGDGGRSIERRVRRPVGA